MTKQPIEVSLELRGKERVLHCWISPPDRSVGIFHPWVDDYVFADGGEDLELTDDELIQIIEIIEDR